MPGETKIFKNSSGWYDVDNPGVYHATRALCRDARKSNLLTKVTPAPRSVPTAITSPVGPGLTSLQIRLLNRLTQRQGVSLVEARNVITNNGHNKAASYGHMRQAGANHCEALQVIDLDSPAISVAYGRARAAGYNHVGALAKALREVQGPQDDDD
jgi:hypothetical protein